MPTNNAKQAAWFAIGSICSFAFGIISSMILSRFIPKADYGTYKQVIYVYETLVVVFTLGLPRAYSYFLPRYDISHSKSIIKKISLLFFILGGLMSASLYLFADFIGEILNNPDLPYALRLFAVVPALLLPTMGLDGILATFQKAKMMALYNVVTKVMMLIFVSLPVFFFGLGYKEAILGFVMASLISFLVAEILIYYPLRHIHQEKSELKYKDIFSFSLPLLFASIWAIIENSADSFFISRYFGKEVYAEFANGNMELPFVGMIIGACATVLSPVYSRMSSQKVKPQEIMPIWRNAFEKSAMLIYPLVLYFMFFADIIMVILFGEQYEISSSYFRIRAIGSFFNVIAIGPLLINIGYVQPYSIIQMLGTIFLLISDIIVVHLINLSFAIPVVQVICRIIIIISYLLIIANYFKISIYKLLPICNFVKILSVSIVILLFLKSASCLVENNILIVLLSFSLYCIIYFAVCKIIRIDYKVIISSLKDNNN